MPIYTDKRGKRYSADKPRPFVGEHVMLPWADWHGIISKTGGDKYVEVSWIESKDGPYPHTNQQAVSGLLFEIKKPMIIIG